jgi:DNA-binding transcriptional MocR family regulator
MSEQEKALYTVAEAAAAWGITRQAVYQRLNKLNKEGFIVVKGKKRYVTSACFEVYPPAGQEVEQALDKDLSNIQPSIAKLTKELEQAKAELLAEQGRANALQATADAQKAHIDSLKTALDREQALHMASLQQRLPAPGKGFFAWLKGRKGTE